MLLFRRGGIHKLHALPYRQCVQSSWILSDNSAIVSFTVAFPLSVCFVGSCIPHDSILQSRSTVRQRPTPAFPQGVVHVAQRPGDMHAWMINDTWLWRNQNGSQETHALHAWMRLFGVKQTGEDTKNLVLNWPVVALKRKAKFFLAWYCRSYTFWSFGFIFVIVCLTKFLSKVLHWFFANDLLFSKTGPAPADAGPNARPGRGAPLSSGFDEQHIICVDVLFAKSATHHRFEQPAVGCMSQYSSPSRLY